jgi:hypothetical protein
VEIGEGRRYAVRKLLSSDPTGMLFAIGYKGRRPVGVLWCVFEAARASGPVADFPVYRAPSDRPGFPSHGWNCSQKITLERHDDG